MKKLLQTYANGRLRVVETPVPQHAKLGYMVVRAMTSIVSIGTEKHMIELAQKSLLGKALAQPD